MLSEEKRNMINPNGLYSHEIVSDWVYGNDKYWCHNWTFKPHIFDDGRVFMYDSYFDSWDSAKDVETKLNINHSHISDCCRGKRNKTGGYSWRFVNE